MDWYYADGNRQCGPISDKELDDLARSGQLKHDTLVWREGLADWQPYSAARSSAATTLATGAETVCSECRRPFSPSDMVQINNSWVCAACKPIFLQRLSEGAPHPLAGNIWRSKKLLVAPRNGSAFPNRCVKCNTPVQGPLLKRTLTWYPPWAYFIGGIIVAMLVKKTAQVEVGLCGTHRSKRKRNLLIGLGLVLGAIALMVIGGNYNWGAVIALGPVALIAGLVFLLLSRMITPTKMDDKNVWMKGVCKQFLDELPEWRG